MAIKAQSAHDYNIFMKTRVEAEKAAWALCNELPPDYLELDPADIEQIYGL